MRYGRLNQSFDIEIPMVLIVTLVFHFDRKQTFMKGHCFFVLFFLLSIIVQVAKGRG